MEWPSNHRKGIQFDWLFARRTGTLPKVNHPRSTDLFCTLAWKKRKKEIEPKIDEWMENSK